MQKILVVEDDFDIRELLQNFLQEAGYEVATANDGIEALSLFSGQRYDLIILDILLPKIDGYPSYAERIASRNAAGVSQ